MRSKSEMNDQFLAGAPRGINWTDVETKGLLESYKELKHLYSGQNRVFWRSILAKLKNLGIQKDQTQCSNKLEALKKKYRHVVDHNRNPRNKKKSMQNYEVKIYHQIQ